MAVLLKGFIQANYVIIYSTMLSSINYAYCCIRLRTENNEINHGVTTDRKHALGYVGIRAHSRLLFQAVGYS
jgi:hypothetical protein